MFDELPRISRAKTILLLIVLPSISAISLFIYLSFYEINATRTLAVVMLNVWVIINSLNYWFCFIYIGGYTKDPKEYFKSIMINEAVSEYQFSRKLFYVALAVFVPLVFIYYLVLFFIDPDITDRITLILIAIMTIFSPATLVLAIRFVWLQTKKDFGFNLAKAYFNIGSQKQNEPEKFKNLILMLDTYNTFLEMNLKVKINIMQIYSSIISENAERKREISESIRTALEEDKLELARQLPELCRLPNKEHYLIKQSSVLNQQFKEVLTIIIPALISIVGFIIAMFDQFDIFGLLS